MKIIICLLIFSSFTNNFGNSQKVAIIGKGFVGGLCSYFLHKMIPGIKIDIYNHQPNKKTLFFGISFISHNLYINDLIKEKNVHTEIEPIFMTKEGEECYSSSIKNSIGYESFRGALKEYVMQQLEIFKQIYDHQKNGQTFKTVPELLKSLSPDFENYFINETTENLLINKNSLIAANPGIQKYIKDGLAGQFTNTNAHGFVGLAFLMFSEIIAKIQQVSYESLHLFIKSLFHRDDKTIEMNVSKIVYKNNQNYVVPKGGKQTRYDFIILATTQVADLIKFKGFTNLIKIFKYRDVHAMFMTGQLTQKFNKILKILIPTVDIQENRIYMRMPYPNKLIYAIFGLQEPSETDILQYVKPYKIEAKHIVHVSPDYSVKDDESLRNAKFELADNLYNAHALHSLSTYNELLAIGAKNIALLIRNEIGTFADEQIPHRERVSSSTVGRRSNKSRARKTRAKH